MSERALRQFARLAALAAAFAFCVAVFGAFVRLSNAGLSCPDWPTCYGRITWPGQAHEIAQANAEFPERAFDPRRAWREQTHRFLAGALIVVTFALAIIGWRRRREPGQPWRVPIAAAILIVFQALLGMWTVTWKLKPVVVMAHLLGGFATFALLVWIAVRAAKARSEPLLAGTHPDGGGGKGDLTPPRAMLVVAIVMIALQVALGGWTSANYAALACGAEYPQCLGQWWPAADFREGFVLWRGIGVDYEGGVLDAPARTAIHLAHRWFALLVAGHLLALGLIAWRRGAERAFGAALVVGVAAQVALGIANVVLGLPLPVASAHHAVAALLLAIVVAMLARTGSQGALRLAAH
ncbi:MAG TPA: COX15/CtaA family protein [Candidatus Saccharimonadia bacterium]|nr:COX15/CtaA family protein [Candidatus Saccharimonadia bacterium]